MRITAIEQSKLAKTGQEYLDLLDSNADWIARSADDVRQLREAEHGAFGKLSQDDFNAFVESLEFARGGVVTGYYKPLMSSLTLTDIFEMFELFGMSREYFSRTLEAKCVDGEWDFAFWRFCASNCPHTKEA